MMNPKKPTFSRQIKDELCHVACTADCCRQAEIAAAFFGAGRFADNKLTLQTAHAGSAQRLSSLIQERFGQEPVWQNGHDLISLTVTQLTVFKAISEDLRQLFEFDLASGLSGQLNCPSPCCQQAVLRALFLACGSISEPSSAYHLELTLRRPEAARMASDLMASLSIRTGQLSRHGHIVVYIKEGQHIADFLLQTGAHHSLLTFESLRVDKEMNNSVNRMVNCDSANTQRIANTAARQLELIRHVMERDCLTMLPADLRATAEARLDNPDLSIKELGEMMQPQLGKSGMNHRLNRLEQVALELLARKGHRVNGP